MKYRIAYNLADGRTAVVIPAEGARGRVPLFADKPNGPQRLETDEEFASRIAAKDVPQGTSAVTVEATSLPSDRHFRNAWKLDVAVGSVGIDMPKARDIHREKLRAARKDKLVQLDTEYMRADELGDQQLKQSIAQQKQALRDLPSSPAIEVAATPDELKATWPPQLTNPYISQQ